MKLIRATKKDLDQFIELEKEFERSNDELVPRNKKEKRTRSFYEKSINKALKQKESFFYFASIKGEYVGYIFGFTKKLHPSGMYALGRYTTDKKIGRIESLIVKKKFRGKGISTKLKNEFFKWLEKNKITICQLDVAHVNKKAKKTYKKWGFAEDKVQMFKEL